MSWMFLFVRYGGSFSFFFRGSAVTKTGHLTILKRRGHSFQIFVAVIIKIVVFRFVTPCSSVGRYLRFREACCSHRLQDILVIMWRSTWDNCTCICFNFVNCTRICLWIPAAMAQTPVMFCTYAIIVIGCYTLRIASIPCFKSYNWSTFWYKQFSFISECRNIFFPVHAVAIALVWPVIHCWATKTGRT
jgi:hypothetical protein